MNPPKLNLAFYRYSLFNRGGDRVVIEYANHLSSRGHSVSIVLHKLDTIFAIDPRIKIVKIGGIGKAGFLISSAFRKLDCNIAIVDIIHLPLLLSLRNSVLYFAQADDMQYYRQALIRMAIDFLYRWYLRRQNPVITVSDQISKTFLERYGFRNSYTVTNGINIDIFHPEPDDQLLRAKHGKKAVFFMDRGDRHRKGYDIALRVLETLPLDVAHSMELWVCGNHFKETGHRFIVRNFGVVSDSRLRQLLSSADIFLYPSRHEGFGLFPLEAMACGCVVVTTDAVPYARSSKGILTAAVNDDAMLRQHLERLIMHDESLLLLKRDVISTARKYDVNRSKFSFEAALKMIAAGRSNPIIE